MTTRVGWFSLSPLGGPVLLSMGNLQSSQTRSRLVTSDISPLSRPKATFIISYMYFLINQSSDHQAIYIIQSLHTLFFVVMGHGLKVGEEYFFERRGVLIRELNSESKTKKRASYKVNILPTGSAHTLSPKSSEGKRLNEDRRQTIYCHATLAL